LPTKSADTNAQVRFKKLLAGSLSIMIHQASSRQLELYPCDVLHKVDTQEIDTFDFFKIEACLLLGDSAAKNAGARIRELFDATQ
jgi:hypothetical protein